MADPIEDAAARCRALAAIVEADPTDGQALDAWLSEVARLVAIIDAVAAEPDGARQ